LGKVDDQERERIESLFLTDSDARERVLAAEQDLTEDYLEDGLSVADRELFLERYGQTPAQQRQLRINKSIKDWALRESALMESASSTHAASVKISAWARLRERLRVKPMPVIPIVVTAMIVIVVVTVWLSSRQEGRYRAIEQELAQLNTPASLREVPPNLRPSDVSALALRGLENETELKKTAQAEIFELHLPWIQKDRYTSYRAELLRVGGAEQFTIPNLPGPGDRTSPIRLRLPSHALHRGHYKLRLTGINTDGSLGLSEEYTFAVSE
jgi:hypothetical protein